MIMLLHSSPHSEMVVQGGEENKNQLAAQERMLAVQERMRTPCLLACCVWPQMQDVFSKLQQTIAAGTGVSVDHRDVRQPFRRAVGAGCQVRAGRLVWEGGTGMEFVEDLPNTICTAKSGEPGWNGQWRAILHPAGVQWQCKIFPRSWMGWWRRAIFAVHGSMDSYQTFNHLSSL